MVVDLAKQPLSRCIVLTWSISDKEPSDLKKGPAAILKPAAKIVGDNLELSLAEAVIRWHFFVPSTGREG